MILTIILNAFKGGNVELVCRVENDNEYPVLWMRFEENGKSFPISTGHNLFIKDSRFKLEHEKDTGTYTLSINKVEASDAAEYQCQVRTSNLFSLSNEIERCLFCISDY